MVIGSRKSVQHGTRTGYDYHKCRCDECRAAAVAYQREHPSAHIPKGLTKAEALVLLDMFDENLDSIAATFDVSREAILELVRSRTYLGASFRRSPVPLRDRIFAVEDAVYLSDESSVVGVGKKPKEDHGTTTPAIVRHAHVGYVAQQGPLLMSRMIGQPRDFVSEEPLPCHACGQLCSTGICRELDNGVGTPHTFRAFCDQCEPTTIQHPDGPLRITPIAGANNTGYLAEVAVQEYKHKGTKVR